MPPYDVHTKPLPAADPTSVNFCCRWPAPQTGTVTAAEAATVPSPTELYEFTDTAWSPPEPVMGTVWLR